MILALLLAIGPGCARHLPPPPGEAAPLPPISSPPPPIPSPPPPTAWVPPPAAPAVPPAVAEAVAALDAELAPVQAAVEADDGTDPAAVPRLLAAMVAVDQRLRDALLATPDPAWGLDERLAWVAAVEQRVAAADRAHAERVAALIDRHGWFDVGRFGAVADQDGWILVQHAAHDPAFQARVLELLADRVAAGQSDPSRYAYLYDRVQALAGRPQRYGTQGHCTGPGAWEPLPLEDAAAVDRHRAEVGLGTLAAYRAQVAALCE